MPNYCILHLLGCSRYGHMDHTTSFRPREPSLRSTSYRWPNHPCHCTLSTIVGHHSSQKIQESTRCLEGWAVYTKARQDRLWQATFMDRKNFDHTCSRQWRVRFQARRERPIPSLKECEDCIRRRGSGDVV